MTKNILKTSATLLLFIGLLGQIFLPPGVVVGAPAAGSALQIPLLDVDFDTVQQIPQHLRQPILDAMQSIPALLHDQSSFVVTAYRVSADEQWHHLFITPRWIIEAAWEVEYQDEEILEVLVQQVEAERFTAAVKGSKAYNILITSVPTQFIDHPTEVGANPSPTMLGQGFLFPWPSGQRWYKTRNPGWHEGYSIDFQPVLRSNPVEHFVVLAADSGVLTETCNDGYQSILRITDGGTLTKYLHLDKNSIRRDLLGKTVQRGQFLGILYNGRQGEYTASDGTHYQYNTTCGTGTAFHLHLNLSSPDITIDGYSASSVANSARSTIFTSSNNRVDNGGQSSDCGDSAGVILYEHGDYSGRCTRFTGNDNNVADNPIGDNAVSSIKIIGNYEATLYEHPDYGGASTRYTGSDGNVGDDTIGNDRVSSIRVSARDAGGQSNCDGGQGVYVYEHGGYSGRCTKFSGDSPNPGGWYVGNDAASSLKIVGSYQATLYEHDNYNGGYSSFSGDDSDLGNDAIGHDRMSSIRVRSTSSGGSSNCDNSNGVQLYEHPNFTGRCSKYTSDSSSPGGWYVGNDAASSIRIFGNYEAVLYEHDNYNGTSSSFTSDDGDLGNDPIGHDRASSLRVRTRTVSSGPTSCPNNQFLAEYYNNRNLSGEPTFRRCEASINQTWDGGGPGSGVGTDNFSVRWTGTYWFENDAIYTFTTRSDDGVRLWVENQLLVDQWRDMGATTYTGSKQLGAGNHVIRMEYYENGGAAVASLNWTRTSTPVQSDGDDGRTIDYNNGLDGLINPANDRDDYYFEGSSGSAITIRMDKRESSLDSFVELYGPNGQLVGQDDDRGGDRNALLSITLTQNGRYKIIARAYGSGTGGYRLSLSRETVSDADDNRWISFGNTLQGAISPSSDRDWYYFSATGGRAITIRMNKLEAGLDSYVELYNPSGTKVAYNDDGGGERNSLLTYMVPNGASGTYRIQARSYSTASSGRYELKLFQASNMTGNLALNKPATASSTEFQGVEPYRAFDGSLSTRWSSSFADPQMLHVDLGSEKTFNQVVLKWESAYARNYGIYIWKNNAWQPVYWTISGDGGTDVISFSNVTARYVAMYGTRRGTQFGYSLWEFEIYDASQVLFPLVVPDDPEKEVDSIEPLAPLGPNDDDKLIPLLGDGETGQENMPLAAEDMPAAPDVQPMDGAPVGFILYPTAEQTAFHMDEVINFQAVGSDNDEDGESITAYEWSSSIDGVLSTESLFSLDAAMLSPGEHTISLKVQDNEGNWSEITTVIITITHNWKLFVSMINK